MVIMKYQVGTLTVDIQLKGEKSERVEVYSNELEAFEANKGFL